MKKTAKIVFWFLLIIAVFGAIAASALKPMDIPVVKMEQKEAYVYFVEEGTVMEGTDFSVFTEATGKILETAVKKGDFINKGDVLVSIDATDLETQKNAHIVNIEAHNAQILTAKTSERDILDGYSSSINELRAQLSEIEARRSQAEAERKLAPTIEEQKVILELAIEKARHDVQTLSEHFSKLKMLYEHGTIPKLEYDTAKSDLDAVQISLRQYETEYAQLETRNNEKSAESDAQYFDALKDSVLRQIEDLTKNMNKSYTEGTVSYYNALIKGERSAIEDIDKKIEKCVVKSPVSGYVKDMLAERISAINPGIAVAVIKTTGETKIEAYVSTKDIGTVNKGDTVLLTLKGRDTDKISNGTVTDIAPWAEEKISALGLYEKKIYVTIEAEEAFMPGSNVDVKFTVYREQDKLLVPTSAIYSHEDKDYVFKVVNGKAVATEVLKGVKTQTETVIEKGLSTYDIVIVEANTEGLREGVRVK